MKKISQRLKIIFAEKKGTFIFFIFMVILGIIFGSLFITILDKSDKELVSTQITNFFTNIKTNQNQDIAATLKNSLFTNIGSVLAIWILGISIIGIPLIILFIFIKSFIFGFSIGGIISVYNLKGILLSIGYLLPHQIINIITLFILSLISFNISVNFLKSLISKKQMDFKIWIGKYYKLLLISLIIMTLSSLMETFLSPYIIKIFTFLL